MEQQNATEITKNMGNFLELYELTEFIKVAKRNKDFDPMLSQKYNGLSQDIFR